MEEMGMTKEMFLAEMKKEGTWSDTINISYKQGNYYTLLNAKMKSWSIYKSVANKIYSFQDGESKDICTVADASIDLEFKMTGKMPTVKKLDTTVMIDGIACNVVRVKWKTGAYDYYYNSSKLNVDANLFANHTYDGWAEYLKISNSLPIRIVKKTDGMMTITMTLVNAKTEAISDKLFQIPTLVADKELNSMNIGGSKETMRIKY